MAYGYPYAGDRRRLAANPDNALPSLQSNMDFDLCLERARDATSGTDGPHNPVTERLPFLAQSRWNSRADASWANLPTLANLLTHTHWLSAQATTKTQPSPETTQNLQQSLPPQWQWENMWAFHSSKLLWPTKERTSQTQVEGGLPLIWTMLHPPG